MHSEGPGGRPAARLAGAGAIPGRDGQAEPPWQRALGERRARVRALRRTVALGDFDPDPARIARALLDREVI